MEECERRVLRGATFVAMVEAVDLRNRYDVAVGG
jgi:hypothetical protein